MPKIAVFGGTGYLASIIKNQNTSKKNKFFFFSRKKNSKYYINYNFFKKNLTTIQKFDFIVHLVGPNQSQLLNNKNLIKKKNLITSNICDLCLENNIKLIYISSLQVYQNYGKKNLSINSKINTKNLYSKSHYESEKIILKKFLKHHNMFTIIRIGNVFGFKKYENLREINNNLIHSFCISALKKNIIIIKNGYIQRSFVPSEVFIYLLNFIIRKNFFTNLIINIPYKNFSLLDVAKIIKKRSQLIFNLNVSILVKKFYYKKIFAVQHSKYLKFNPINKKIYFEIDRILQNIKRRKNLQT
jgi:nucleoside-diphosphate-sugar epimerase